MSVVRWILFSLFALVLVACGGSSDNLIAPKAVIAWPSQTREINAPAYAASAVITLTPDSSRAPITWTADRPAGTGAQTLTYPGPQIPKNTTGALSVAFKSSAAGAGTTVATASVDVKVGEDGTILNSTGGALGTVGYSTTLTGITVDAPNVAIGGSANVVVTGHSSDGIVALPQDLITLSITSGDSFISLTNGVVTGIAEGSATIQANYESFTASDTLAVTIPTVSFTRYAFPARKIAADLVHNKVWGTFSGTSLYPNSIVDIDVATGTIGTPIFVGAEPDAIGISPDGTVAYVGLNTTQTIKVVDLTNRTAGATLNYTQLDANTYPCAIAVNPTNNNEIAIGVTSAQNGTQRGPYVIRTDGTAIAATFNNDGFQTLGWLSGTEIVRMQSGGGGGITKYGVTSTTVDKILNVMTNQNTLGDLQIASNSRIVSGDGRVFSDSTFSTLASLYAPEGFLGTVADPTHDMAWAAVGGTTNPLKLRTFELNNYTTTGLYTVAMNNEAYLQIIRFGTTGIAIRSTNSVYVIPNAPGL